MKLDLFLILTLAHNSAMAGGTPKVFNKGVLNISWTGTLK